MSIIRIVAVGFGLLLLVLAVTGIPTIRLGYRAKALIALVGVAAMALGVVGLSAPRMMLARVWHLVTGEFVDVGGYRLRIDCQGSGEPTVVMDSGLDLDHFAWGTVPEQVVAFTRVCTYDRAGIGESEVGPQPRTSRQIVNELDLLLKKANIHGPLILVGHSFGGMNMRLYASQHPRSVVGLVLVDALHEDQIARFGELMSQADRADELRHEGGDNKEQVNVIASSDELRDTDLSHSLLLTVLSAKSEGVWEDEQSARLRTELQQDLARLVPQGKHIIVANSGHFIQLDQPQIVIDAIHDMVDAARRIKPTLGGSFRLDFRSLKTSNAHVAIQYL